MTSLGSYRYRKWGGTCEVDVYPCGFATSWPSGPSRACARRRWLPVRKAARKVDQKKLGKLIARLPELVGPAGQPGAPRPPTVALEAPRLVHLFRHAKSSWSDPNLDDFDRPLAPRGERACEAMGEYFRLGDLHPGLVVCSAALRTRQTRQRVLPAIGEDAVVKYYRGLYLVGPQAMLSRLRRTPTDVRRVMLVAHNPGMQTLALRLASEGPEQDLRRLRTSSRPVRSPPRCSGPLLGRARRGQLRAAQPRGAPGPRRQPADLTAVTRPPVMGASSPGASSKTTRGRARRPDALVAEQVLVDQRADPLRGRCLARQSTTRDHAGSVGGVDLGDRA